MYSLDLDLVREIENSIAACGRDSAISSRKLKPETCSQFCYAELCGGTAVFTGVGSPLTQTIGAGLNGAVSADELDELEHFYFSRGAACALELSPYIDSTLLELLRHRPYHLTEFSNVLLRGLAGDEAISDAPSTGFTVRSIRPGEERLYTETISKGFADEFPVTEELLDVCESFARLPGCLSFLAEVDSVPAGGGSVGRHGRVGGLFGASTLPQFRRRGIQSKLLEVRLHWLQEQGCEYAYVVTHPATSSQRNMERSGFRATYSRVKLTRDLPSAALCS